MKYFFLLLPFIGYSQKIFTTDYTSQSDIKVFVVDYESQSDLKVFKVDYQSQSRETKGYGILSNILLNQIRKSTLLIMSLKVI